MSNIAEGFSKLASEISLQRRKLVCRDCGEGKVCTKTHELELKEYRKQEQKAQQYRKKMNKLWGYKYEEE